VVQKSQQMHNKKNGGKRQALLQAIRNAEILADKTNKNPQQQWNLVIHCETADHKSEYSPNPHFSVFSVVHYSVTPA
jgi:hypothetical protein